MLTFFASLARMKGCCSNSRGYGLSVPLLIKLAISPTLAWTDEIAHQVRMKCLIGSDHVLPIDGSSIISGTGAVTIYDSNSIGATYADSPSGGKGNRRWATSCSVKPSDQTSALIEYCCPCIRSGWRQLACLGATHGHVVARPRECPRNRIHQLSTDPKVAQLDRSITRNDDVRRLNISVDDAPLMQVV